MLGFGSELGLGLGSTWTWLWLGLGFDLTWAWLQLELLLWPGVAKFRVEQEERKTLFYAEPTKRKIKKVWRCNCLQSEAHIAIEALSSKKRRDMQKKEGSLALEISY